MLGCKGSIHGRPLKPFSDDLQFNGGTTDKYKGLREGFQD